MQNHAARLLSGTGRCEHITPTLIKLHWLPVLERIKFKVLSIVQKCVYGNNCPKYLQELLSFYKPRRCLRSSYDVTKLNEKVSCRTDGDRSFRVLAPKLWNSLPLSLRIIEDNVIFQKQLKTYLFKCCCAFT